MTGKRILICCNRTMNLGGIEKALTTLIKSIDAQNNHISLVICDSEGPFIDELKTESIHIIHTSHIDGTQCLKEAFRHFRISQIISGLWNRLMLRLDHDWYAQIMYMYRIHKPKLVFPGHFDCAIAYSTDYSDLAMIVSADADKRIAFVHGDATYHKRSAKLNDKLIRKLDMVYSVSHEAKDKFLQMHPRYSGKTDVIHNVVLENEIRQKSQDYPVGMVFDDKLNICTVARLSPEKRQYLIPGIARRLLDDGLKFRWYLIGGGSDREHIEKEIQIYNVEDHVILLGPHSNPYPYIKNCDLYVQTSVHEAYCLTVAEARILGRPIVTTDATGVREQFQGDDGMVVSQNSNAIYEGVRKLLIDEDLRRLYSKNLERQEGYVEYDLPKLYEYIME